MMLNRRDFSAVLLAGAAASMILISGHISDIAYWHIASVCCGTGAITDIGQARADQARFVALLVLKTLLARRC